MVLPQSGAVQCLHTTGVTDALLNGLPHAKSLNERRVTLLGSIPAPGGQPAQINCEQLCQLLLPSLEAGSELHRE